jgi:hypothetical protein
MASGLAIGTPRIAANVSRRWPNLALLGLGGRVTWFVNDLLAA